MTKVIVKYLDGGWYSFSPNGHAFYNNDGDIKVKGIQNVVKALDNFDCVPVRLVNSELLKAYTISELFEPFGQKMSFDSYGRQ